MEAALTAEITEEERRARDRNKAATAAIFLARSLGIRAEPAFDLTSSEGRVGKGYIIPPLGEVVHKDAFDMGCSGEDRELQLLLVDERGNILAESKELYSLGQALELLDRLPMSLSPGAEQWLKDALGNAASGASQTEQEQCSLAA